MKHNLMFEDLEGALMLISFDTVDEDGVVERETLAYTYADGKLKFYTLDADGVVFDASFNPADHEILKVTTYDFDPDDYEDATDLVKAILKHEGREIIKEAPYNEWEIVDNKVTWSITLSESWLPSIAGRGERRRRRSPLTYTGLLDVLYYIREYTINESNGEHDGLLNTLWNTQTDTSMPANTLRVNLIFTTEKTEEDKLEDENIEI